MSEIRRRERVDGLLFLKELGEESASTEGAAKEFGSLPEGACALVIVTGKHGTDPALTLKLQGSEDRQTWDDLGLFPPIGDIGKYELAAGPQQRRYYRYQSVLAGTDSPSFTYLFTLVC